MRNFEKFIKQNQNLKPPINIEKLITDLGITIDYVNASTLNGFCFEHNGRWHIAVKSEMTKTRQRFTLAHELKHFLENENACAITGYMRTKIEREANDFAGKILVPGKQLLYQWNKNEDIGKMAEIFAVSREVIRIRLKSIGIIT